MRKRPHPVLPSARTGLDFAVLSAPTSTQRHVAVLVGSLRKDSFNRKIATLVAELASTSLALKIVEIGPLSLYNQDEDSAPPESWTTFRSQVSAADAVLFVTPEYNRSVPGVLKNAIDIGSRPYGKSVWDGKPGAVISVTPGALGAFGANHHLRQTLVAVNVPAMTQPEVYIAGAGSLFDEKGALTNERTRELLKKFVQAFGLWIEANIRPPAAGA